MSDAGSGAGVLRLSLNVPALERLLGGDSTLEVDLRHQVARQFTHDHLMPLANSDTIKEAVAAIQLKLNEAIGRSIHQQIGVVADDWRGKKFEMTASFKAEVDGKVKSIVEDYLRTVDVRVNEIIKGYERHWATYADRAAARVLDAEVEKRIREGIQSRLDAVAKAAKGQTS